MVRAMKRPWRREVSSRDTLNVNQSCQITVMSGECTMTTSRRPSNEIEAGEQEAKALLEHASALRASGHVEQELATYDEVVRRYGGSPETGLATAVATALERKARALAQIQGRADEALAVYDDLIRLYGGRTEIGLATLVGQRHF